MDVMSDFSAATALVRPLLAALATTDLARPTPCAGWTVEALADHLVVNPLAFVGFADPSAPASPPATGGLVDAYDAAVATVITAFGPAIERNDVLTTPFGEFPAAAVLGVCFADQLTHAWDLSAAMGREVPSTMHWRSAAIAVWEGFITDGLRAAAGRSAPRRQSRPMPRLSTGWWHSRDDPSRAPRQALRAERTASGSRLADRRHDPVNGGIAGCLVLLAPHSTEASGSDEERRAGAVPSIDVRELPTPPIRLHPVDIRQREFPTTSHLLRSAADVRARLSPH